MNIATSRFEEKLTDLLIDKIKHIEKDPTNPWLNNKLSVPRNINGYHYSGGNRLMLSLASEHNKWDYPVFMTFKMAQDKGVNVLKGAKSTPILCYNVSYQDKETKERITSEDYNSLSSNDKKAYEEKVYANLAFVFNVNQTNLREVKPDLWSALKEEYALQLRDRTNSSENSIDSLVRSQAWLCPIYTDLRSGAYYAPAKNEIHITPKEGVINDEKYYSVLLHEMTHSTGHPDLLARNIENKFGSPDYAREELVAELGSALTGTQYGLPKTLLDDNAVYLKSWLSALKAEPDYLQTVLSDAVRASNMIIDHIDKQEKKIFEQEEVMENSEIVPYAELYAHERNMNASFLDENHLTLPESALRAISLRSDTLRDLELTSVPEEEKSLIERKMKCEDSIRDTVRKYVSEKYGFNLPLYIAYNDKLDAVMSVKDNLSVDMTDEKAVHEGLASRLPVVIYKDDTEENRRELDDAYTEYAVLPSGKLKVKGVARLKEGYTLEDTAQARRFMDDNNITYQPIKGNRLFVSMRSQKIALLLAATFVLTPIVGVALMYALNKSRALDHILKDKQFSEDEAKRLNQHQTIRKTVSENGRKVDKFYFLDNDTHRLRSIPAHEVRLPNRVNGVQLSPKELSALREGQTVSGFDENSKLYFVAQLDLNDKDGVRMGFKEMKAEREFKSVPTPNSPDEEKIAYVQMHGAQGVNDIWDRGGVNLERDSFLDKYDIEGFYKDYLKSSRDGEMSKSESASNALKEGLREDQQISIHR